MPARTHTRLLAIEPNIEEAELLFLVWMGSSDL